MLNLSDEQMHTVMEITTPIPIERRDGFFAGNRGRTARAAASGGPLLGK
jgi:hypothetical protein